MRNVIDLNDKTVFITGGTGFIGTALAQLLSQKGVHLRCLVRNTSLKTSLQELGAELIEGDVTDKKSLYQGVTGSSIIFHLAGLTRAITPHDFMRINSEGCENVAAVCLDVAEKTGTAPILVSISSLAAVGPGPCCNRNELIPELEKVLETEPYYRYRPCRETDCPHPVSPYGKSKLAGEKKLLSYADRLPITVFRPPYVFGPRDPLSVPLFKIAASGSRFPIPGYYDQRFSFVYVEDLVELLVKGALYGERLVPDSLEPVQTGPQKICSGVGFYFPGFSELPLFSEFGKLIARSFGRSDLKCVKVPPAGVIGTGIVQEIWKRIIKKQVSLDWNKAIEAIRGPWICSNTKLIRQFNYHYPKSLEERIRETTQWYLCHNIIEQPEF